MARCLKKRVITIIGVSLIIIGIAVAVVVVVTFDSKDSKEEPEITVIKNNVELKRPNVKLNAEMELVKMGNNMTGLIISDPYASIFYIQFTLKYGSFIDTIPGISHLGEHMSFQSCEKYNYEFRFNNFIIKLLRKQIMFYIMDFDRRIFTSRANYILINSESIHRAKMVQKFS